MQLEFRMNLAEQSGVEEIYSGFLQDFTAVLLLYQNTKSLNFNDEIEEIKKFRYALDKFPEEAFADIAILYAEVQGYMSRTTAILSSMYEHKVTLGYALGEVTKIYKKARNRILSRDPDIPKLKNAGLQDAAINDKLVYIVDIMEDLSGQISFLEEIISIVQLREKDLDRANVNISRQQRLVESLIALNYGVKPQHKRSR